MKKIILIISITLIAAFSFAQTIGSAPEVSNVRMEQNSGIITVTYDLSFDDGHLPAPNPTYSHITLVFSDDNGATFRIYTDEDYFAAGGDFGSGVTVGDDKQIIWNAYAQYLAEGKDPDVSGQNWVARIIARRDDNYNPGNPVNSLPAGMVFVEGTSERGPLISFNPGGEGYFNPGDTGGDEYNVSLSSFYISQFEVTQDEWTAVMVGIYDPDWTDAGQGPNHPAYRISWFDAIEYCNRRSMMEGLEPCYSYEDGDGHHGTNPDNWASGWNTSNGNHTNVSCNWEANGYRLPTEMEREFAARGGVPAVTGTNTFNHTYAGTNVEAQLGEFAWYWSDSSDGTKAVGTKLPNELGLYDMSGNVWNWVWDIRADYPTGEHNNPTGPTSGSYRMRRGGSWSLSATNCTVSNRSGSYATIHHNSIGFRVSRVVP